MPARPPAGALGCLVLGAFVAATSAAAPRSARAQAVLGGYEDATVPRRGEVRVRVLGAMSTFDQRYGGRATGSDDALSSLGARFTFDTLGAAQVPALGALQRLLPAVTDSAPETVTLGRLTAGARAAVLTVPLAAEVGLTRRLSLGVVMPIVRTRQSLDLRVDTAAGRANAGFNPADADAFGAAIGTDARARNRAVQAEFAAAVTSLEGLLARCPAQGGTTVPAECAPVVADRARAAALVTAAGAFARGLAQVYGAGDTTAAGSRFVPVAGSALQRQVVRRLTALATQFRAFGVTSIATATAPAGSPARLGVAGVQRIVVDPAFGVVADSLQSTLRSSIGDVDVGATVLLVDTFGEGVGRLAPSGFRVRAAATAGFRFGVIEGTDIPFVLFDLPTAGGANAVLVRGAADVAFGRRAWGTVVARYAAPLADELAVRVTDAPEPPFPELARERLVGRQLGAELEFEVTPRLALGDFVGVAGHYAYRRRAASRYTGQFQLDDGTTLDASSLDAGTASLEQRVGLGITYSTVASTLRGRARVPVEVSYLHTETIAGSGGAPKLSTDVVQARLYFRAFGRR